MNRFRKRSNCDLERPNSSYGIRHGICCLASCHSNHGQCPCLEMRFISHRHAPTRESLARLQSRCPRAQKPPAGPGRSDLARPAHRPALARSAGGRCNIMRDVTVHVCTCNASGGHMEITMGINTGLGAGSVLSCFVLGPAGYTGANGEIVACDWPGGVKTSKKMALEKHD